MPINAISDRGLFIAAPTRTMGHQLGFPFGQLTPKIDLDGRSSAGSPSIPNNLRLLAQRFLHSDFWVSPISPISLFLFWVSPISFGCPLFLFFLFLLGVPYFFYISFLSCLRRTVRSVLRAPDPLKMPEHKRRLKMPRTRRKGTNGTRRQSSSRPTGTKVDPMGRSKSGFFRTGPKSTTAIKFYKPLAPSS